MTTRTKHNLTILAIVLFIACCIIGLDIACSTNLARTSVVNAQEGKPVTGKIETVDLVLTKEQVLTIENLTKEVRIKELEIQNAIPKELREALNNAIKARDEYWMKTIGVKPEDMQKVFETPEEQKDGSIRLKRRPTLAPPPAPTEKPKN